jgi:hypothetical protein
MSTSTDGILAYGYDLTEWAENLDEGAHDWLSEDDDSELGDAIERTLLAAVGFTATWETWDKSAEGRSFYAAEDDAKKLLGVELVTHCSGDYPAYILAAKSQTASRGCPRPIDLTLPDNADERLRWAVGVLGISQLAEPQWLLASYWG